MEPAMQNRFQPRAFNILVADDQLSTLNFMRAVFRSNGHRVLQANDGEGALEILREDYIELLVTDLQMPRLDGIALVKRAREIIPDIKVVLVSGGIDATERRTIEALRVAAFLEKPFSAVELISCIEKVLGAPQSLCASGPL